MGYSDMVLCVRVADMGIPVERIITANLSSRLRASIAFYAGMFIIALRGRI